MATEGIAAYPLQWPVGWHRRPAGWRPRAKFGGGGKGASLGVAVQSIIHEMRLLGAADVVISTNVRPRLDGLPSGEAANPSDPAGAVYFRLKGNGQVLACDKWDRLADNLMAIAKHVEAVRGQVRWGVGSLEQAFGGYKLLTAVGAPKPWWEVLGLPNTATLADVDSAQRRLLRQHHPDQGGDPRRAADINEAAQRAHRELG
jgi:hypothetical protein